MLRRFAAALSLSLASGLALAGTPVDRDYVTIVGVPQVLKYADAVTNAISATTNQKYPLVAAMTAGTGIRLFCGGLASDKPDLYLVSSSSSSVSTANCKPNGVNSVLRLPIGRDAMVFSILADQKPFVLSRRAMYLALAARVPATDDSLASDRNPLATTFVPNRFTRWSQIDSHLPDIPIRILAPPAQSIEWWSINDIVMRDGCRAVKPVAAIERIAPPLYGSLCYNRRTDGVIVYARGQDYADNPIVQPVQPNDVAIGPLQMLERSKLSQALPVEGVLPSPGTIISGKYPLSRVVSLYVKPEKYSIVPGLQQYVIEMTSPSAVGPDGYLTHLGLIPLPELELREIGVAARYSTP